MSARVLSAALVAELLGISGLTFRRRRAEYERAGFPRPLNLRTRTAGNPLRYDAEAIEAWFQRQRPKGLRTMVLIDDRPAGEDAAAHHLLAEWRASQRSA